MWLFDPVGGRVRADQVQLDVGQPLQHPVRERPSGETSQPSCALVAEDHDPGWALDLRVEPMATVRHGRTETPVRARETHGAERDRLWQLVCAGFPTYATYQRRTSRPFPVFVLEPDRGVDVG